MPSMVSLTLAVMFTSTAMSSKPRRLFKGKGATFSGAASSQRTGSVSPLRDTPCGGASTGSGGHSWHCHQHQPNLPLGIEGHPGVEVDMHADTRQEPHGHLGERQLHDPQPAGMARGTPQVMALNPAPHHLGSAAHTKPLLEGWVSQRPFRHEMAKDMKFSRLFCSLCTACACASAWCWASNKS